MHFYDTRKTPKIHRVLRKGISERIREEGARKGRGRREKRSRKQKTFSAENVFNEVSKNLSSEIKARIFQSAEHQQTHLKSRGTKGVQHVEVFDWCISQCITYYFSFPLYLAGCHNNLLFVQIDSLRVCIGYKTVNKKQNNTEFQCKQVTVNLNLKKKKG